MWTHAEIFIDFLWVSFLAIFAKICMAKMVKKTKSQQEFPRMFTYLQVLYKYYFYVIRYGETFATLCVI